MTPTNRIATDSEILQAAKDHETLRDAAASLGMAYSTIKNRLSIIRQKQPEEPRPTTYTHTQAKRYFISSVVSNAPLSKRFFQSVQVMCEHLQVQQIYIPVEYDWQDVRNGKNEPTYPQAVGEYLLSEDIKINEHLMLMGSVPIHATIQNPLVGLKHVSHNKSAIFAHPQRAMDSVATPKRKLPKLLYTTGAITEPRYTRSKTGRKAQDHHIIGGLLIEVDGDRFHVFEITAAKDGGFYHLTEHYSPKGVTTHNGVAGIYMADEHAEFYDDTVKHATYTGDNSIVRTLSPEIVVRGDVYNHGSDSHHERKNVLNRVLRAESDRHSVQGELDQCYEHIANTTVGGYKNAIVASNHHDHLKRWLNEYNPHTGDPRNAWLYHHLNAMMIDEAVSGNNPSVDPFELYGRYHHAGTHNQCVFIERDGDFDVAGVDCSMHGDAGANGARGSAVNLSLGGQPVIIGHGHSPRIYRNVYQVGVCAQEMGYNKGYSGWMATHCVIYPDGNRTLVHIVDSEWRI